MPVPEAVCEDGLGVVDVDVVPENVPPTAAADDVCEFVEHIDLEAIPENGFPNAVEDVVCEVGAEAVVGVIGDAFGTQIFR